MGFNYPHNEEGKYNVFSFSGRQSDRIQAVANLGLGAYWAGRTPFSLQLFKNFMQF